MTNNVVSINPPPSFLDQELWNDYLEYRKEIGKPLTPTGIKRALRKLEKYHRAGQDIEAVIERTIESGKWTGLYMIVKQVDIKDDQSVMKTGKQMGIQPKPGESSFDYARRVLEAQRD